MDVLEHIPDIVKFIETIKSNGVDQVLIKIPLLEGPGGWISELLAKLGKGAFLETLLLKEDVSPHVHFFTSKGLIQLFQRKGFALESKFKFAEVGAELAERNRAQSVFLLC